MEKTPRGLPSLLFLRAWLANPLRVGAITPSGTALARLITREIGPSAGPVLELGPGTGVFTQALIDRGVKQEHLTLVELNEEFAELLSRRFPDARLLRLDATRLASHEPISATSYGAVVSGLPLLSMPMPAVFRILSGAIRCLRAGGGFYQFTYGPRCPVPAPVLSRLGLEARWIGTVMPNLPPASVYRIALPAGQTLR